MTPSRCRRSRPLQSRYFFLRYRGELGAVGMVRALLYDLEVEPKRVEQIKPTLSAHPARISIPTATKPFYFKSLHVIVVEAIGFEAIIFETLPIIFELVGINRPNLILGIIV